MLALLLGCSSLVSPCPSTCSRLYEDCGIQRAGRDQAELVDFCREECASAWGTPGEAGDYDPFTETPATQSVELENRAQVDLWAQCIDESSCDDITDGMCAPVW